MKKGHSAKASLPARTDKPLKAIQPRLIVISAPSGAGKTTLCEMLLRDFTSVQLSISITTRTKRPSEEDGKHYHFVDKESFKKMIDSGKFAEWATVHGQWYGTPKENIENCSKTGKHLLFDIDVQGAMSLKKIYKDKVLLIFIHAPSLKELEERLLRRKSDSLPAIETRLQNAYNELEWSQKFDYQVTNDELNRAYKELKEIIQKECR